MSEPAIFQSTVIKSTEWVDEVCAYLGIRDRTLGLRALRTGLHTLRDRLPAAEAVDLGAQLPMLIRGLYYEGWRIVAKPAREDLDELRGSIRADLANDPRLDPEVVLKATIHVLAAHVTGGELDDVHHVLPRQLANLWDDAFA